MLAEPGLSCSLADWAEEEEKPEELDVPFSWVCCSSGKELPSSFPDDGLLTLVLGLVCSCVMKEIDEA